VAGAEEVKEVPECLNEEKEKKGFGYASMSLRATDPDFVRAIDGMNHSLKSSPALLLQRREFRPSPFGKGG
jgi:hypothetical protein